MGLGTRRDFIRLASTAIAFLTSSNHRLLRAATAAPIPSIHAWTTTGERRFEKIEVEGWRPLPASPQPGIEIDTTRRFQSILGFGGAFTDASCYLLSQMDGGARHKLIEELTGPTGLQMSVGRTCIGASDYSRNAYSFDDGPDPDPDLKRFSIAHDREYILPILRAVQETNPEMYLFSAPWSPPGWMKAGGSMLGGSMRKPPMAAYAQYFVKFLQAYQAEGVKIHAVTTQNEVDTDQDGRMPAALWGQEYEAEFIKEFLGPALEKASLDTKIWLLDHNYDLWGRVVDQLEDPAVFRYVDGVAWHGYGGKPNAMTKVHDAFPSKHTYWTEGGPDITDTAYATDFAQWSGTFAGILRNWARCIVSWNVVLDERGMPNIGPFTCGGLVTLNSRTHEITRSGQYWAFAHYSKAIQRDARVVQSSGESAGVDHVAFLNPDSSHVLVVTNRGGEKEIPCYAGGQMISLNLPHDSITTLLW
jgi:glucosylceramidase